MTQCLVYRGLLKSVFRKLFRLQSSIKSEASFEQVEMFWWTWCGDNNTTASKHMWSEQRNMINEKQETNLSF